METGEGNLMEISECSSPCSLKVSLLKCLSAWWLLVIHSGRQTDKNTRESGCTQKTESRWWVVGMSVSRGS